MPAFIGEIRIFAGNFAPAGWALCNGQAMPISEYEPLFNLIGTTYGGDGLETFNLPDLQGRVPIHMGAGYTIGQQGGVETVTLMPNNLPLHKHVVGGPVYIPAFGANPGIQLSPNGNFPAITAGNQVYSGGKHATNQLAPLVVTPSNATTMMTVQPTGNSLPKENMQPFLVINFIISLYGIFPSQT
jgi:microcystin-dependent protein